MFTHELEVRPREKHIPLAALEAEALAKEKELDNWEENGCDEDRLFREMWDRRIDVASLKARTVADLEAKFRMLSHIVEENAAGMIPGNVLDETKRTVLEAFRELRDDVFQPEDVDQKNDA